METNKIDMSPDLEDFPVKKRTMRPSGLGYRVQRNYGIQGSVAHTLLTPLSGGAFRAFTELEKRMEADGNNVVTFMPDYYAAYTLYDTPVPEVNGVAYLYKLAYPSRFPAHRIRPANELEIKAMAKMAAQAKALSDLNKD